VPVPVVDLPLGATEDRVVGALDLERALTQGVKAFEPGLLARANRGFLYIDEVNLLEDHLVDLLIDVAASGENVVEREGLSVRHPARFVLVGSGNPEEGELRPQLLDRFGLSVEVRTPTDLATRVEVVRRRDAYERDPDGLRAQLEEGGRLKLRRRIVAARERLAACRCPTPRWNAPRAVHGAGHRRPARRADADARGARAGRLDGDADGRRRDTCGAWPAGAAPPAAPRPAGRRRPCTRVERACRSCSAREARGCPGRPERGRWTRPGAADLLGGGRGPGRHPLAWPVRDPAARGLAGRALRAPAGRRRGCAGCRLAHRRRAPARRPGPGRHAGQRPAGACSAACWRRPTAVCCCCRWPSG
jgi:hypothetical protein